MATELDPTKYKFDEMLVEGVYYGVITVNALPQSLFDFTYLNTMSGVVLGYGDVTEDIFKLKRLRDYKKNLSFFSGAKTWQHVNELSLGLFDEAGQKVSFTAFKKIAKRINPLYNETFLKTELNTGFSVAQGASLWDKVEETKDLLPWLTYQSVGDGHVRPEHAAFDGITAEADDDFWNSHMPPNDWGCRCTVIQTEKGAKTNLDKHLNKYNSGAAPNMQVKSLDNTSKLFKANPGKTKYIYPPTHPYNDIPKQYRKSQKDNFGLVTPGNDEVLKQTKKI